MIAPVALIIALVFIIYQVTITAYNLSLLSQENHNIDTCVKAMLKAHILGNNSVNADVLTKCLNERIEFAYQ